LLKILVLFVENLDAQAQYHSVSINIANRRGHIDRVRIQQREDFGLLFAKSRQVALILLRRMDANNAAFCVPAIPQAVGFAKRVQGGHRLHVSEIKGNGSLGRFGGRNDVQACLLGKGPHRLAQGQVAEFDQFQRGHRNGQFLGGWQHAVLRGRCISRLGEILDAIDYGWRVRGFLSHKARRSRRNQQRQGKDS
jgi:hypothetical protein